MKEETIKAVESFYTGRVPDAEPSSTSRKSPYYSKDYALALQPEIDAMLKDATHDRKFFCSDFGDIKVISLYLRLSQSFNYLVDHMDDKYRSYKILRQKVYFKKDYSVSNEESGVILTWRRHTEAIGKDKRSIGKNIAQRPMVSRLMEHNIAPILDQPENNLTLVLTTKWKQKLADFLEDGTAEVLAYPIGTIDISETDQLWIKEIADACGIKVLKLTGTEFKLFKGELPTE